MPNPRPWGGRIQAKSDLALCLHQVFRIGTYVFGRCELPVHTALRWTSRAEFQLITPTDVVSTVPVDFKTR